MSPETSHAVWIPLAQKKMKVLRFFMLTFGFVVSYLVLLTLFSLLGPLSSWRPWLFIYLHDEERVFDQFCKRLLVGMYRMPRVFFCSNTSVCEGSSRVAVPPPAPTAYRSLCPLLRPIDTFTAKPSRKFQVRICDGSMATVHIAKLSSTKRFGDVPNTTSSFPLTLPPPRLPVSVAPRDSLHKRAASSGYLGTQEGVIPETSAGYSIDEGKGGPGRDTGDGKRTRASQPVYCTSKIAGCRKFFLFRSRSA